jgi:CheY-like chemotaxis protein
MPRKTLRILVVEDEYYIAQDLADALVKEGVEVVGPVADLERALDAVSHEPLHAAVLDINLRGKMAFKVAAALRDRGIPFGFSTGYSRKIVPDEFRDVPLWEKPIDTPAMIGQIVMLAGRQQA